MGRGALASRPFLYLPQCLLKSPKVNSSKLFPISKSIRFAMPPPVLDE